MERISFNSKHKYDVVIGESIHEMLACIAELAMHQKIFIVTEQIVAGLYLNKLIAILNNSNVEAVPVIVPAGEYSKSPDGLAAIHNVLIEQSASRNDIILNLGGGMIGDLGGFAAATYMRGIRYINMPTTLLSMVDSSMGGKTAINFNGVKNVLGAFHSPSLVIINTGFLDTISENEMISGMGEIIKYAAIEGGELLKAVTSDFKTNAALIKLCCEAKKKYVEADEFDIGKRKILNFGHTFGHAFESASGFNLSHGAAIGLGMIAVCKLGAQIGFTDTDIIERLTVLFQKHGLKTNYEAYKEAAVSELHHDKKGNHGMIDMVFIKKFGEPFIKKISLEVLEGFLNHD